MTEVVGALLPPAITLVMFVVVLRAIIGADRRERRARARIDAQLAARATPGGESGTHDHTTGHGSDNGDRRAAED